jgi:HAD superfamily hydrolase (TIGR01490 family)
MARTLALFDLDNTLLTDDSDYLWGRCLADAGLVDGAAYEAENARYYALYKAGGLDIHEFLAFALRPLRDVPLPRLLELRARFVAEWIAPRVAPGARPLIERHRRDGHLVAIITATNRFVTGPIAGLLGVPALIATEPERDAGGFTGRALDPPCFQAGKVSCLERWQKRYGYEGAYRYFYSDSHNDLPLLEQVDVPVAVDADPALTAIAATRGWAGTSLRSTANAARAGDG